MDDEALMRLIAHGDASAFQRLYTLYAPRLSRYLWRELHGDRRQVEEALQDVFLTVWRSAKQFRAEAPVSVWLFRIARFRVAHLRRDGARRPEGHLTNLDTTDDASQESLSHHALGATSEHAFDFCEEDVVERLALHESLGRLSLKHREVLELVFVYGFSMEETASILDTPVGTIKSRLSYARRALLRELTQAQATEEVPHDAESTPRA